MVRKRSRSFIENKKKGTSAETRGGFTLLGIVGFVLIMFYFWGRVQIDFILRQNDQLRQEKQSVQRELDELLVQVNTMKSYQRIVSLAEERGMVFPSTSNLEVLPVDLTGIRSVLEKNAYKLEYANFTLKVKKQGLTRPGREDGDF